MRRQIFKIILITALLFLVGCKTLSQNVKETKNELIGSNIDALFSKWGAPTMSAPLQTKKGTVYTWDRGGCNNNVTADSGGIITEYTATGNCSFIQW